MSDDLYRLEALAALDEALTLAAKPLPGDPGEWFTQLPPSEPQPLTASAAEELSRVFVPAAILGSIRAHAESAPPEHETVGRLVIDTEHAVAVEYLPLPNLATGTRKTAVSVSWRREPGRASIIVHSHPHSPEPSPADLTYNWPGIDTNGRIIGIYRRPTATLGLYRIADDRRSCEPITASTTSRRGLLIDLARREMRNAEGALVAGGFEQYAGSEWLRRHGTR